MGAATYGPEATVIKPDNRLEIFVGLKRKRLWQEVPQPDGSRFREAKDCGRVRKATYQVLRALEKAVPNSYTLGGGPLLGAMRTGETVFDVGNRALLGD